MSVWAAVPKLMKTAGLNYFQLSDLHAEGELIID